MTERYSQLKLLAAVAMCFFISTACTSKPATSTVTFQLPGHSSSLSNKVTSQNVSALSSPWDEMCYFINVTGGQIKSTSPSTTCDIPKGKTTDQFLPAGSNVSMEIDQGSGYTLQLIGFQRNLSSDPCPVLNSQKDLYQLNQAKLFELGKTDFNASGPTTTVTVNASVGSTLQSQYSLSCTFPTVALNASTISVSESGSNTIDVVLSAPAPSPVTVTYSFAQGAGTATPSLDFPIGPFSVTVPQGQTNATITVTPISDTLAEPNETYDLNLSLPAGYVAGSPTTATVTIVDDDPDPTVNFPNAFSVNESNGTFNVTATLSAVSGKVVTVPFTLSGTSTASLDYSFPGSILIPAGQLSAQATFTLNNDSLFEPDETIVVTMNSVSGATPGVRPAVTVTLVDDDVLSTPTIAGISGASDGFADANLNSGVNAKVNFSTVTGADLYDVTIYLSDGVTVACPTQQAIAPTNYFYFSACALTPGASYKAQVVAESSLGQVSSPSAYYDFLVNQAPIANNDGPFYIMKNSGIFTINVLTNDTDPDGDSFTITSYTAPSKGTVNFTASTINYTPTPGAQGSDSFTYDINDGRGGTATATVNINIMTPFTWTGAASNIWSTPTNWCGMVNGTNTACSGSGSPPATTDDVYFDETCSSANCIATTASNVTVNSLTIIQNGVILGASTSFTTQAVNGFKMQNGTFNGSAAGTSVKNNKVLIQGGSVIAPATWTVTDWEIYPGATFVHNNGTMKFESLLAGGGSPISIKPSTHQYKAVNLNADFSANADLNGQTMDVTSFMTISLSGGQINNGTFIVKGNVSSTSSSGGSAVIRMNGTAQSVSAIGALPNIIADGTSLTLNSNVIVRGDFTVVNGAILTSTGSTLQIQPHYDNSPSTIDVGGNTLNNLTFANVGALSAINIGSPIIATGTVLMNPGGPLYINGSVIHAQGNLTASGSSLKGGTTLVAVDGNGPQTISGSPSALFPSLFINKSTGALTYTGTIATAGNYESNYAGAAITAGSTVILKVVDSNPREVRQGSEALDNFTIQSSVGPATVNFDTDVVVNNFNLSETADGLQIFNNQALFTGPHRLVINGNYSSTCPVSTCSAKGDATVVFAGSGSQNIYSQYGTPFGAFEVNKTGGNLSLTANFQAYGSQSFTYVQSPGIPSQINLNTSTFDIGIGTLNLNGQTMSRGTGTIWANGTNFGGTGAFAGGTVAP